MGKRLEAREQLFAVVGASVRLLELPRVPDYPITRPENVTTRSYPIPDFSIFQLPDTRKLIFGYPRVEDRVFLLNKKHSLLSKTTIVVLIVMPSRTGLFMY